MTLKIDVTVAGVAEGVLRDQIENADEQTFAFLLAMVLPALQAKSLARASTALKQVVEARKASGEALDGLPNLADEEAALTWYFAQQGYMNADARRAEKNRLVAALEEQRQRLQQLNQG